MEQAIRTKEQQELSKSTTSSKRQELVRLSETEREDFEDRILTAVHDSFGASSQDPTLEQIMARTAIWSRLLFGIVPAERFQHTFDRAFRDKPTNFPVDAYDLKNAWQRIEAEEKAAEVKRLNDQKTENAIANCSNRVNHVDDDRAKAGEGLVELYDPIDDTTQVVPCWGCRPRAYEIRTAEIIESKRGLGVPEPVTKAVDEVTASMDMNKPKIVQDDGREYLQWATGELIKTWQRAPYADDVSGKKFSYPLFGRTWYVSVSNEEISRIGLTLHNATEYIRLGPVRFAEMKGVDVEWAITN